MKHIAAFIVAVCIVYFTLLALISMNLEPVIDQYYRKLLSTHNGSMILGDSRAGQGIEPKILNQGDFLPFYNFAFTIGHTPWGDPYNKLIKKKFNGENYDSHRVFILSVSPWTLQGRESKPFPESVLFTNKLYLDFYNPNFEYLIRFYDNPLINPLNNIHSKNYVDENGRNTMISESLSKPDDKKKQERIKEYTSWIKTKGDISKQRLRALADLIKYLKNYGKVILVRIPAGDVFIEMENQHFPEFNQIINQTYPDVPYLDFFSNSSLNLEYTDGCHLTKKSGNNFSRSLLKLIESETNSNRFSYSGTTKSVKHRKS